MTEPAAEMAGVPDAFQRLWTPHRMVYIEHAEPPIGADEPSCPFCRAPGRDDQAGLVVHRGETCYVVMNLYPYSPGHMLVCTYRHVAMYTEATAQETMEMAHLTQQAVQVLAQVSRPAGFNIGMNQGLVAGAGVAEHLHQHVVPRWQGDTNFLPIVAQTRALPQLLEDARSLLSDAWPDEKVDRSDA